MALGPAVKARDVLATLYGRTVDELGAVATEYGLVLMLIALAIVVAAALFGVAVADLFDRGTAGIPGS